MDSAERKLLVSMAGAIAYISSIVIYSSSGIPSTTREEIEKKTYELSMLADEMESD